MKTIHLEREQVNKPTFQRLIKATFPSYSGKKFRLVIHDAESTIDTRSYWDGGSKDYFKVVNLQNGQTATIPAQSAFDPVLKGAESVPLGNGIAVVEHSIFCGKDTGLRIHIAATDLPKDLLPEEKETFLWSENVVLYSFNFKNSYAGRKDVRKSEARDYTEITSEEYNEGLQNLINKGLVKPHGKSFMLTEKGRTAQSNGPNNWPKR